MRDFRAMVLLKIGNPWHQRFGGTVRQCLWYLLCQNPSTSNVPAFNWKSEWIDERKKQRVNSNSINQQILGHYYRHKEDYRQ